MDKDKLFNKFKPNVYMKPDEYLNGWARKCGWKATLVYDSLWRHADKFGNSFPSIQLMAEEHGVSYNTIRRGLKTLIEYNLVKKEAKRSKKGRFLHNTYTLTNKNEWKDISIAPTGLRSSIAPTGNIHSPHRAIKDTHKKDTHIIPKGITRQKPRGEYGNPEINSLIKFFKERFGLPLLDGSEQQNRRYCHLAIVKFGGADKVRLLIETAANSDFWSTKISSFMDLYYKGVRIINETRSNKGVGVIS